MTSAVEVQWVSDVLGSSEHCVIQPEPGVGSIVGTVELQIRDSPATIRYRVDTNSDWTTAEVVVDISGTDLDRSIVMQRQGSDWIVDGQARPDLAGCTNVDLGWTPATNTLVLRSNPLAVGQSYFADSAWLRFPQLDVVAASQLYTRFDDDTVQYESATFIGDLVVTADDVVAVFDDGLWRATELRTNPTNKM